MEKYREIRIEITSGEIVKALQETGIIPTMEYKLNNTLIPGFKDIGLNGWITFILREKREKNATTNKETIGTDQG